MKKSFHQEVIAKLHDSEKSMILAIPCKDRLAGPDVADETIPERVGESMTLARGDKRAILRGR